MDTRAPALALALTLAVAPATAAEPSPSHEERRRLAQGEVVFRTGAAPRDGAAVPGARGGVAFVRIPTEPAPVWAILTMPRRRYPEIFPGLRTVEVLEEQPAAWLLRTDGKFGPFTFSYHTRYQIRVDTHTITWRLDPTRDNDVFEDTWGSWHLVVEDGGTLIVYAIGSIPASWQPLAGYFERRGIIQALGALRDAALRRAATPTGRAQP